MLLVYKIKKNHRQGAKVLLKKIGNSLLIHHKIVGRVEIVDQPELLWHIPSLIALMPALKTSTKIGNATYL